MTDMSTANTLPSHDEQLLADPVYPAPDDGPSIEDRVTKLEALALQYFGADHFETPAPVFNPQAAADDARARFMKEMQEIEAKARATAN